MNRSESTLEACGFNSADEVRAALERLGATVARPKSKPAALDVPVAKVAGQGFVELLDVRSGELSNTVSV